MARVAKAAFVGHGLQRPRLALQARPRRIHPHALDELGRRHPRIAQEDPREVAAAHVGHGRQRIQPKVRVQVAQHVLLHLRNGRRLFHERRQERAELRLPARALREHHQPLGHIQGDILPDVLRQQIQRQVDARRHARRRLQAPVLHV
ncbi:hypothetical protein G6F24_013105 [Rhizopus arrhizus]|nr:hypothetical protein G6F24_013105 [Rhizopus arrhizus]